METDELKKHLKEGSIAVGESNNNQLPQMMQLVI